MAEQLTCTKLVRRDAGQDNNGKTIFYHEKCGAPAAEHEIGGLLLKAKAVLCVTHKEMADREAFISANGFPHGRISEKAKKEKYQQQRLPGTGIVQPR